MYAFISLIIIVLALGFWAEFRNRNVYLFRVRLISEIADRNRKEFAYARTHNLPSPDTSWRWTLFGSVTYNQMVLSVKPLTKKAFYGSEDAFLTPTTKTASLI
jgi:hypothetical protein